MDYSLSDVAAAARGNDYGMDGGWIWLFPFLLLLGGGNGFFGNRGNVVTEADLCNANSFSELKGSVRNVSDQIASMNVGLTKGLCDFGYTTLSNFNAIERQLADCCCVTQRAVDSVKFDMANYFAASNANTTAGIQKVLDALCQNKIEAQAQRINQLELQQALCGVVRYPNATTYTAGYNPFCNYNCACGTNI